MLAFSVLYARNASWFMASIRIFCAYVFSCSLEFGIKKSVRQGAWFDVYNDYVLTFEVFDNLAAGILTNQSL